MKYVSNHDFFVDLKKRLSNAKDVIISTNKELDITIFFQEQMCNISDFNRDFLPILLANPDLEPTESLTGIVRDVDIEKHDVYQIIFSGLLLLYAGKREKFYLFEIGDAVNFGGGLSVRSTEMQNDKCKMQNWNLAVQISLSPCRGDPVWSPACRNRNEWNFRNG